MLPLEVQIKDHKAQLQSRLDNLAKINEKTTSINEQMALLKAAEADLKKQRDMIEGPDRARLGAGGAHAHPRHGGHADAARGRHHHAGDDAHHAHVRGAGAGGAGLEAGRRRGRREAVGARTVDSGARAGRGACGSRIEILPDDLGRPPRADCESPPRSR